jgi:hypothetical protein
MTSDTPAAAVAAATRVVTEDEDVVYIAQVCMRSGHQKARGYACTRAYVCTYTLTKSVLQADVPSTTKPQSEQEQHGGHHHKPLAGYGGAGGTPMTSSGFSTHPVQRDFAASPHVPGEVSVVACAIVLCCVVASSMIGPAAQNCLLQENFRGGSH